MSDFDDFRRIVNRGEREVRRHQNNQGIRERQEGREDRRDLMELAQGNSENGMRKFLMKHANDFTTDHLSRAIQLSRDPGVRDALFDSLDDNDPKAQALIRTELARLKKDDPARVADFIAEHKDALPASEVAATQVVEAPKEVPNFNPDNFNRSMMPENKPSNPLLDSISQQAAIYKNLVAEMAEKLEAEKTEKPQQVQPEKSQGNTKTIQVGIGSITVDPDTGKVVPNDDREMKSTAGIAPVVYKPQPLQHKVEPVKDGAVMEQAVKEMDDMVKTEATKRADGRTIVKVELKEINGVTHVTFNGKEMSAKDAMHEIPDHNDKNAYVIVGADGKNKTYAQMAKELKEEYRQDLGIDDIKAPTFKGVAANKGVGSGRG